MNFRGDTKGILDEEHILGTRLEKLVFEFQTRFEQSGQSFRDFIWGHWRQRMAEECIPLRDKADIDPDVGIRVDATCESLPLIGDIRS